MASNAESTDSDRDGLLAEFAGAVSSIADGDLTFQKPFDLPSSAALADNIDAGDQAQLLFDVTALRDCGYRVHIEALSPHQAHVAPRELVSTSVPSTALLITLLEDLIGELQDSCDE